jgi:tetratricopeptide (TPR) repeat protein
MNLRLRIAAISVLCALASHACARNPETAKREYVRSGDAFIAKKQLSEAIIQYRRAVQVDPLFGEARFKLGKALNDQGDPASAYAELVRAADLMPSDLDAQIQAGTMSLRAGQFQEARARADRALGLQPRNVEAQILKGNALAGLKDLHEAIAQVEEAVKTNPDSSSAYGDLGVLEFAQGDLPRAEQALRQAVRVDPKSVNAYLALANFYWASGKRDAAEAPLKAALAIDPASLAAGRGLAYLYVSMHRSGEAEAPLKSVVDRTRDPIAQLVLADLYRLTDRHPLALQMLDAAAGDPKAFAVARARKAALLSADGRKTEAYAAVQEILTRDANSSIGLLAKAQLLSEDKDLDQALKLAQRAAAIDAITAGPRFAVGRIEADRGNWDEAAAAYRAVLKVAPKFAPAHVELAKVDMVTGRPKEALQSADDALLLQPGNADAMLVKAGALIALGDVSGSEPLLRRLVANFPNDSNVQAQLGSLYMIKRDAPAARAAYERALSGDAANLAALSGLTNLDLGDKSRRTAVRTRIDAAVAKHPDSAPLLLLAGHVYMTLGNNGDAERCLRKALDVEPSNLEAYGSLALVLYKQGRIDEALKEYQEAAKLKPTSVPIATLIGILLEAQHKPLEAQKQYEKTLGMDSHAGVAANNLARIYVSTGGNLDVALHLAQTARSQLPNSTEVSFTLGWVYYRKGLASLAIAPLQESLAKDPDNASYLGHLGLALAKTGQRDKARDMLRRALAQGTDFPDAKEARDTLSTLTARTPDKV